MSIVSLLPEIFFVFPIYVQVPTLLVWWHGTPPLLPLRVALGPTCTFTVSRVSGRTLRTAQQ
jgi:hypothetical protein